MVLISVEVMRDDAKESTLSNGQWIGCGVLVTMVATHHSRDICICHQLSSPSSHLSHLLSSSPLQHPLPTTSHFPHNLSHISPSSPPLPTPIPSIFSTGAIAGIAIGIIVFVIIGALAGGFVYYLTRDVSGRGREGETE